MQASIAPAADFIAIDGKIIESQKALIPVAARGFRFGDGVFSTIRLHAGRPWRLAFHLQQLAHGLAALRITCDLPPLLSTAQTLVEANGAQDACLRIYISRGTGSRGYLPLAGIAPLCVMEILPLPAPPETPLPLWHSRIEKPSLRAFPVGSKLAALGVNATLARLEAADHGCGEALQCLENGDVAEASAANIFWLQGGVLHTPAAAGIYAGSTRAALLECAPWPVKETHVPLETLQRAEAVFLTSATLLAAPVHALQPQGWQWDSAPAAARAKQALEEDIAKHCGWEQ